MAGAVAIAAIPAGIIPGENQQDGHSPLSELWDQLRRGDWSSSAAAYATAVVARGIIEMTGVTIKAFAAECKTRHISGWGSQGAVSRRLRWALLHDSLWEKGILPPGVFLSESATRPLFDGKLTEADRLRLLAELFGPFLTDEQKRDLAEKLSAALMKEHLARAGQDTGYRAPRRLVPETVIARLLAQGMTAGQIAALAHRIEDSARNAAKGAE